MLARMERRRRSCLGHDPKPSLDADTTRCAFDRAFEDVPAPLRKSLTYDRGTDLSGHSQTDLNIIAERLNNRPRKILDFQTPNEVFAELLKLNQQWCTST